MTCHGVGAVALGAGPDLRASSIPLDTAPFSQIVQGGALLSRGMPRFDELSTLDLEALRHYIRQQAMSPSSRTTAPGAP
jgi:quinohemoprotein ethanol dehydrogenase